MAKRTPALRTRLGGAVMAVGRLLAGANASGFDSVGHGQRVAHWRPSGSHVNSLLSASGSELLRQSRDLVRRNPNAANAVAKYASNAVGTGIKPRSLHPDEKIRAQINDLWSEFVDESDAAGVTNFYGQQVLAARAMFEGGDCFARLRPRRAADGLPVPLQIELLESEMVPIHKTEQAIRAGHVIRSGIEFDAMGRRVAYHVHRNHPGDSAFFGQVQATTRVPADQLLHMFKPLRPGQIRGVPSLASVILRMRELDQYQDGTLAKQRIAASLTGFVTQDLEAAAEADPSDGSGAILDAEIGTLQVLNPGEDIRLMEPPKSGDEGFVKDTLRAIAAGLGLTYEQYTGDLSGVNYSSIRAGLVEFRRETEQYQTTVLIPQFCRPTWRHFIEAGVMIGRLPAAAYRADPRAFRRVAWVPQGWRWIDPLKEVQAMLAAMDGQIMSRQTAIQQSGYDPDVIDAQIAEDLDRRRRFGLEPDAKASAKTDTHGPGTGEDGESDDPSDDDETDDGADE